MQTNKEIFEAKLAELLASPNPRKRLKAHITRDFYETTKKQWLYAQEHKHSTEDYFSAIHEVLGVITAQTCLRTASDKGEKLLLAMAIGMEIIEETATQIVKDTLKLHEERNAKARESSPHIPTPVSRNQTSNGGDGSFEL